MINKLNKTLMITKYIAPPLLVLLLWLVQASGCSHDLDNLNKPCASTADCPGILVCGPGGRCIPGNADLSLDLGADGPTADLHLVDQAQDSFGDTTDSSITDAARPDTRPMDLSPAEGVTADLPAPDAPLPDLPFADLPIPDAPPLDMPFADLPIPDAPPLDMLSPDLPLADQTVVDTAPADLSKCAIQCNDGLACTVDTCGDSGCVNTLLPGNCLIYKTCFKQGDTYPGDACRICDTSFGRYSWAPAKGCVITLAGMGTGGYKDGPADSAEFKYPCAVTVDAKGDVLVADRANNLVRKISDGVVSTVGGTFGTTLLDSPRGIAVDSKGDIYVSNYNSHKIKVISGGALSVFAGAGNHTLYKDGPAASATFFNPWGLAVSPKDELYVADSKHHTVRMVYTGNVTTVAGLGGIAGGVDGSPPSAARFKYPSGVALDGPNKVYVADTQNHKIRLIALNAVTTVAGTGSAGSTDGAIAKAATFYNPTDVAVDPATHKVYIADQKNHRLRVYDGTNVMTLNKTWGGFLDGPIASALFKLPTGLFVSKTGYLYIADVSNNRIRVLKL